MLPIRNTPDGISVFVPGGPDDDSNKSFIPLSKIILGFKPEFLPERHLEGHSLSIKKRNDHVSVFATNDVQEGDYLVVMGKSYCIYAKTDDEPSKIMLRGDVSDIKNANGLWIYYQH